MLNGSINVCVLANCGHTYQTSLACLFFGVSMQYWLLEPLENSEDQIKA